MVSRPKIKIRRPDDWHVHFRRELVLETVLPYTAKLFGRALIMPNTKPEAIRNADDAKNYLQEIQKCYRQNGITTFEPIMSIEGTEATTPETVIEAVQTGVRVVKLYPANQTTNSQDGVTQSGYQKLYLIFEVMSQKEMVLSLHGELPDFNLSGLKREEGFLCILCDIAKKFPRLRIVLEHVTTFVAIDCVESLPANVAATITLHHLLTTIDDVIGYSQCSGGKMQPHLFCKPVPKYETDRQTLIRTAIKGNPKFFFGSDTAPHLKGTKECADVCAGIFSAPVAMPCLIQAFADNNSLNQLGNFTSVFGAEFYDLPQNQDEVEFTNSPWTVPKEIPVGDGKETIVPFLAGQQLNWQQTA